MASTTKPAILNRETVSDRYTLVTFLDRWGDIEFHILDNEDLDWAGLPNICRQESSKEAALAGLL